jgi:lysozyme family protein
VSRAALAKTLGGTGAAVAAILGLIFAHEGGYVNDPNDPGGATNWGCTEAVARANGYTGAMRAMPRQTCLDILRKQYIEKPGFMPIVEREPVLAYEIIDTGVNAGPGRASVWFQASLNVFSRGGRDYAPIPVDGAVGPATIRAFDALRAKRGPKRACELMVKSADAYQAAHYQKLCTGSQALSSFCIGWFDNRIGNAPIDKCGTGSL